jgi:hypothetical protein
MFELLDSILNELKEVPGLSFLKNLHLNLRAKHARLQRHYQVAKNRRHEMKEVASNISSMRGGKGSKSRDS